MHSVSAAAGRIAPTLAAVFASYVAAGITCNTSAAPISCEADDHATTPTCQKDFLESSRADVFRHTAPGSVKTGSKVHGRMQIFAGNGNPDLADEIGEMCCSFRALLNRIFVISGAQ